MNRTPSRTDIYEAHENRIATLRNKAQEARTISRAYLDLSEEIGKLPTRGAEWDKAQAEAVRFASERANQAKAACFIWDKQADELEAEGPDYDA